MSATNNAVVERQLKKIYDCLNIGCYKKAVQEVDRLPKNLKDLTLFKALKSLALIRMYKRQQAFDILNEIDPNKDLDEVTLQTMTSCYKESVVVGKIVDIYEAASKRRPNDPEIMAHLFMAYVRVFNFKRQKEIALQMYKSFPKKKRLYSFWAIMSLVMQAQESENASEKTICLSIAEKMCEKMIDDERTQEEIDLYLLILSRQNKFEEEYRFLTGPIFKRFTDHLSWYNRRRAYLCLDLKMYSRAFKHYFPSLIQEFPDQLEYYQGLFKSAFLLDTEAPSQQQPVATNDQQQQSQQSQQATQSTGTPVKSTSALAECYDIVERQCLLALDNNDQNKNDSKTKNQSVSKQSLSRTSSLNPNRKRLLRGPFIARVELYHIVLVSGSTLPSNIYNLCKNQFETKYVNLNSILLDFFQAFSRKIICYYDLDYMINKYGLSVVERRELVRDVGDWLKDIKQSQPDLSNLDSFHITLNFNMLEHAIRDYNPKDNSQDRLDLAKRYIDLYDNNRYLGGDTNKTEFQPVDNYCLLAVNSIMTNSVKDDPDIVLSDSVLISLIALTENAISNSPTNHQLKLMLLKLYSFIGASKQSSEILFSLDIKNFQIDTLGHLLNPVLYNTGNFTLARESLETCLELYTHGIRECFEGLTTSYRDGRFSKIEEISNVYRRLRNSLNAIQCVLLKGILSNICASSTEEMSTASQSFDSLQGLQRIFSTDHSCDVIKDSRDYKVLKSLHFETNELLQKRQNESLQDEKLWLRFRYYLLRSVYMTYETLVMQHKENQSIDLNNLPDELERATRLLKEIDTAYNDKSSDEMCHSYLEPERTPFRWTHTCYKDLAALAMPLVFIRDISKIDAKVKDGYVAHLESIANSLELRLTSINSLASMKQAITSLTLTLEFISLCATSLVALSHASDINNPAALNEDQNTGKFSSGGQQPQQGSTQQCKSEVFIQQMINRTETQLTRLSNLVKSVDVKSSVLDKCQIEPTLMSDKSQTPVETSSGSLLTPILCCEKVSATLGKIREKIFSSYTQSLSEIESACRRKVKFLRSRTQ